MLAKLAYWGSRSLQGFCNDEAQRAATGADGGCCRSAAAQGWASLLRHLPTDFNVPRQLSLAVPETDLCVIPRASGVTFNRKFEPTLLHFAQTLPSVVR